MESKLLELSWLEREAVILKVTRSIPLGGTIVQNSLSICWAHELRPCIMLLSITDNRTEISDFAPRQSMNSAKNQCYNAEGYYNNIKLIRFSKTKYLSHKHCAVREWNPDYPLGRRES